MKNLYDPACAAELRTRLDALRVDSPRQWGKMTPSQVVAHCAVPFEWAFGDVRPPRMLIGRILGGLVKGRLLGNDDPMRRNSPTTPDLVITDERDLEKERVKLRGLMQRFVDSGPAGCTTNPHPFFGTLTPQEWATLMYKHMDHHLRQFGA